MQIEGIGEVTPWGEYWLLTYDRCGHDTYFSRTGRRLFEDGDVEREVRAHYATCDQCRYAERRSESR